MYFIMHLVNFVNLLSFKHISKYLLNYKNLTYVLFIGLADVMLSFLGIQMKFNLDGLFHLF